jgi:hypothetical protein
LKINYSEDEYNQFVNPIPPAHSSVRIDITIWFEDGTWATFYKDNGEEYLQYWVHHVLPDIPEECINK